MPRPQRTVDSATRCKFRIAPMAVTDLPALNACLNSISTILLGAGYYFIRRREIARHKMSMIAAFVCSCLFLTSYLTYHYHVGSVPFTGQGWIRPVYFTILITHIILAAAIVPLALITLYRAWRGQFDRHKRIARWTWPLWMYVSVTGVVIYLMLYQM
jgi:uncharacterized membrane protein YozB (DUF420 family)